MGGEPLFQLDRRVRVLQPGEFLSAGQRGGAVLPVARHRVIHDVAPVVGDELLPPVRVRCRRVTHPTLVAHARCGRGTELADELLTRSVFTHRQIKDSGDLLQTDRQAEVRAPDHGAAPLGRIQEPAARHELWMLSGQPG